MLSYAFAKQPSQNLEEATKEGVDTAFFYDNNPSLPPLATAVPIKTSLESKKTVHIKMNLKGRDVMLALAKDVGVSNVGSDGKRRVKLDLVIALKTHFRHLHKTEKTNYHNSICFEADKSSLFRKRKEQACSSGRYQQVVTLTNEGCCHQVTSGPNPNVCRGFSP
jgi:hypothetical protein